MSVNPAGNAPEINCQLFVPLPPVAARIWEYGVLTTPLGNEVVVIVSCVATVRVRLAVAVCAGEPVSVTLKLRGVAVTPAVGVPSSCPVVPLRVIPAGSEPEVNCQL